MKKPVGFASLGLLLTCLAFARAAEAPAPYGPVPSPRQLAWHELEMYGFLHFSINTFTDREWGYGDEAASAFNPTDFSPDQIALAARAGGLGFYDPLTCSPEVADAQAGN